jgi:hypothetical protein
MDENIVSIIGITILILIFVNINNLVNINNSENFKSNSTTEINKSLIDTYLDYNKKVYEYVSRKKIPDRIRNNMLNTKPITVIEYYNKAKNGIKQLFTLNKCGYIYNFYENDTNIPGSMYLTNSGIVFNNKDKNNKEGLSDVINENLTLVISDGETTYQLTKKEIHMDPLTSIITVYIDPKTFKAEFKTNTTYVLYPCSTLEHIDNTPTSSNKEVKNPLGGDNSIHQSIVDSNVNISFLIYLGLLMLILLVYNWKFVYNTISNLFSKSKKSETESTDSEIKNIYYVGGYDYKDYSE